MGTSKGYIAPSTPKWADAKRGVSIYLSDPSESLRKTAASKFARAMNADDTVTKRASAVFSKFVSFVSSSHSNGLTQALDEHGKNYINSLPPEEVFNELINSFSDGNTIDNNIANSCISEALEVLDIYSLDDLSNVDINDLIKELVCQFAKQKFGQMFDKQIRNKCKNVLIADKRLEEMQDYIYFTLRDELTEEIISEINPLDLANEEIIKTTINTAFNCLENCYD